MPLQQPAPFARPAVVAHGARWPWKTFRWLDTVRLCQKRCGAWGLVLDLSTDFIYRALEHSRSFAPVAMKAAWPRHRHLFCVICEFLLFIALDCAVNLSAAQRCQGNVPINDT